MNTDSGILMAMTDVQKLPQEEQAKFVPVKRSLTLKEKSDMQIRLYAPCGCGSGKKFKFCCRTKESR